MSEFSTDQLAAAAIDEITRRLGMFDRLEAERRELRTAIDRAAKLLDYFCGESPYFPPGMTYDDLRTLYVEHLDWIERQRQRGDFLPASRTKRPVARRKRKGVVIGQKYAARDGTKCPARPGCQCVEQGYVNRNEETGCDQKPTRKAKRRSK